MQPFPCSVCEQLLFFDNWTCLRCGSKVGYVPETGLLVALRSVGEVYERIDGNEGRYLRCSNRLIARCNWMVPEDDESDRCESCRLTSVRPNDTDVDSMDAFADAEAAKRRLLHQLRAIGLPVIDRSVDVVRGVTFELLSSRGRTVVTGHESGVIRLDLSESDDAHREFVRQQLGEPYRTVLGHLRHEIGHYYWPSLVEQQAHVPEFRALFGDERLTYEDARVRYYAQDDVDWSDAYVSQYATMHPWEDWAETFAHYLHIHAGLSTAESIGLTVGEPARSAGRAAWRTRDHITIGEMVQSWLGLSLSLNAMARSIGQADLYPFVLSPNVVEKLDFVHRSVGAAVDARPGPPDASVHAVVC
ncbi:MAG: putative zinc-binding metallopeptidase [Ilumatobacter sp.]|uniref:zinc-binding metallopeptidase family protein n=1 Tax=Ilumatobacter sp. TaxID=1967498 RepID=UPI003C7904FF